MVKINISADCGNSPRKEMLRDFNIAFAKLNTEFIFNSVSENITWVIVGSNTITGKVDFETAVNGLQQNTVAELILHRIITHGKEAAAHGEIIMNDGKRYSFCDIYEFTSASSRILKSIHSFNIETTD